MSSLESYMAHLTKSDFEQKLLAGMPVYWNYGGKKPAELLLGSPKARCLFHFLLSSDAEFLGFAG